MLIYLEDTFERTILKTKTNMYTKMSFKTYLFIYK